MLYVCILSYVRMPSNFSCDQLIKVGKWHVTERNDELKIYVDKDQLIILFFVMKLCMYVFASHHSINVCILFRPCCVLGISINSLEESFVLSIIKMSQNMVNSYASQLYCPKYRITVFSQMSERFIYGTLQISRFEYISITLKILGKYYKI